MLVERSICAVQQIAICAIGCLNWRLDSGLVYQGWAYYAGIDKDNQVGMSAKNAKE